MSCYQLYSTTQEAWDGMKQAILAAKTSIYWEVYIFIDDEVGMTFFDILEQKAKDGVIVKLIVDWWGSFGLSKKRIASLRSAGVDVQIFHARMHRYRGWWNMLIKRTHRKILVIDETIGFIGGVNIQKDMADWLDIHLKLEGRVVRSLGRSFAKSYILCGGDKQEVLHLLTAPKTTSRRSLFRCIFDHALPHVSRARNVYVSALQRARKRVIFFSPYYFPDRQFMKSLWEARRRGIRIDLLVPFRSDVRFAAYAAYIWYGILHAYGVNIHFVKKMMHGKGVIVDDSWAMVGSSNLNQDSFYDHLEANITFRDKQLVQSLLTVVNGWRSSSFLFTKELQEKRGIGRKTLSWICFRLYSLWHPK